VSFAISNNPSEDILSLTLLRSPRYQSSLTPSERGISVSWEKDEDYHERLLGVEHTKHQVKLYTTKRELILDLSWINGKQINSMRKVIQSMNFDKVIKLKRF
jgi:hypothetical protein